MTSIKKIALLTREDDEIHATLNIDDNGHLILNPNWNHYIVYKGNKHLSICPNWAENGHIT